MRLYHHWAMIGGIALGSISVAQAEIRNVTPTAEAEAMIKRIGNTIKIRGWFAGPGNLLGVAAMMGPNPLVFFTDPQGQFMVTGIALHMKDGRSLVDEASRHYFPESAQGKASALPNAKKVDIASTTLEALAALPIGKAETTDVAYMLVDFNCGHCKTAVRALLQNAGRIRGQVRLVPIAFSGESGEAKGAYALATNDVFGSFDVAPGKLTEASRRAPGDFARQAAGMLVNTQFAEDRGVKSTPYFIYRKDGAWVAHDGFGSVTSLIESLGVN